MLIPNKAQLFSFDNGSSRSRGQAVTDYDIRGWVLKNLLSIRIERGDWIVYVTRGKQLQMALFVPKARQAVSERAWNRLINGRDPMKYAIPHNPNNQAEIERLVASVTA